MRRRRGRRRDPPGRGPGLLRERVGAVPGRPATGDAGAGRRAASRRAGPSTVGPNFAAGERILRSAGRATAGRSRSRTSSARAASPSRSSRRACTAGRCTRPRRPRSTRSSPRTSVEDVRLIAFDESKSTPRLQAILWQALPTRRRPGSIGALFDGGRSAPDPLRERPGHAPGDSLQILLRGRFVVDTPAPALPRAAAGPLAAGVRADHRAAFDARPAEGASPYLYVPVAHRTRVVAGGGEPSLVVGDSHPLAARLPVAGRLIRPRRSDPALNPGNRSSSPMQMQRRHLCEEGEVAIPLQQRRIVPYRDRGDEAIVEAAYG